MAARFAGGNDGGGFFDADRQLAAITAKGDPLEMIARVVPFESFRAEIEAAVLPPVGEKKSTAGRKPIDVVVMFRMLVLQSLYNLSDEQVEYHFMTGQFCEVLSRPSAGRTHAASPSLA
jgi:Transposase domain (DUF772)